MRRILSERRAGIIGRRNQDELKTLVGRAALAYVPEGATVGVGTGSTVDRFTWSGGRIGCGTSTSGS